VGISILPALFTAGQPSETQMAEVAKAGCRTVINLALPTSTNALPDERAVVTHLGMEYLHLPVSFEHPTVADYLACETALLARQKQKTLLHCALNWRVSSFIAAYRVRNLGWTEAAAWAGVRQVWDPDQVWRPLIADLMARPKGS
jgi:protein tyrosine phosphatase (PTP) superfamily phosphohydrolase (DUF442 family)